MSYLVHLLVIHPYFSCQILKWKVHNLFSFWTNLINATHDALVGQHSFYLFVPQKVLSRLHLNLSTTRHKIHQRSTPLKGEVTMSRLHIHNRAGSASFCARKTRLIIELCLRGSIWYRTPRVGNGMRNIRLAIADVPKWAFLHTCGTWLVSSQWNQTSPIDHRNQC